MAPRSKLPNCRECGEPAYEELQDKDGSVMVTEMHKVGCGLCPIAVLDPDPRATKVCVRYHRGLTAECRVRV